MRAELVKIIKRKRGRVTSIESAIIWGKAICTKENPCEICRKEQAELKILQEKEARYGNVGYICWFGEDAADE